MTMLLAPVKRQPEQEAAPEDAEAPRQRRACARPPLRRPIRLLLN